MSAELASIATDLEAAAGASTSANANESGYWSRIMAAAEALAGATTSANDNLMGRMKRTAVALESIAGTSGAEENTNESGYMKRIVDALEVQAGAVTAGSLLGRLVIAAGNATFETGPIVPDFANVAFLSGFEGLDDGTTVTDESSNAHVVTVAGAAVTDTGQKKFGTSSLYLPLHAVIETNKISCADHAAFEIGADPFTLEGWYRWEDDPTGNNYSLMKKWLTTGGQRSWQFFYAFGTLQLQVSSLGTAATGRGSIAWAAVVDTWHHLAADFDGADYRIYADGVCLVTNTTGPVSLFDSTAPFTIGSGTTTDMHVDEVRVVNGQAVYASNAGFDVPTAAFPRS